ncbi:unnamed protein product [Strongylus vulgaris]|uniref:Reverse transcriptase domain-containing protein n=1 Tax=Strongylus vulgaris TaxID=40348 RepID=A0A3P7JJ06_STRVU|nr:unnamed protein product [Strongylus vulgaris]
MLKGLNEVRKRIGLRPSRKKTPFMKNAFYKEQEMDLYGSPVTETSSYVYLGRSINMENDLKEELNKAKSSLGHLRPLEEATDQLTDPEFRAHLFDSTFLPTLCYAAEMWSDSVTSKALRTTHRALERRPLKYNRRTQHLVGLRSSVRSMSCLRDPAEYVSNAKR